MSDIQMTRKTALMLAEGYEVAFSSTYQNAMGEFRRRVNVDALKKFLYVRGYADAFMKFLLGNTSSPTQLRDLICSFHTGSPWIESGTAPREAISIGRSHLHRLASDFVHGASDTDAIQPKQVAAIRSALLSDGFRFDSGELIPKPERYVAPKTELVTKSANSSPAREESLIRLFVSHAFADLQLAEALVKLVHGSLEVPSNTVRCTSVDGYKLRPGDTGPDVLRADLANCSVVIGLLTKESLASNFVIMELGAAWAFKKQVCPLLGKGVAFEALPTILRPTHGVRVTAAADMAALIDVIATSTGWNKRSDAERAAALSSFIASAKKSPATRKPAA